MNTLEFLTKHKITPDAVDMETMCSFVMNEMRNGLEHKPSSLQMINSYCPIDYKVEIGKPIIVIDAGGTNFRTCLVSFDEKMNPIISDFQKREMPGSKTEVSAKEFFSIIADETQRLIEKSDRIGFCFSYAAQILPDHDGIPLMFSKEIKAPQVIGKHLGKEILNEFARRGIDVSKKKIIILNDTVTTLLAGLTQTKKLDCDGCVGFILGTGTNTAYIEKGTIINEESGCLKISLGDIDYEFLQTTKEPDKYCFEKMISGAYLGHTVKLILTKAKEEGLLSPNYPIPEQIETWEIRSLKTDNKDDDKIVDEIVDNFVKRAAKLTAVNLASSILFTDYGKEKPILINADGTTYYKTEGLRENTEKYLSEFLLKHGRKAVFTQIEQSPIIGSAIGALSI